jgi:hypothetical protein
MMKKFLFFTMILVASIILSACKSPAQTISEKASEKIAEKAIEKSSGGKADVDINKNNVSVNTEEGSMQAGENVKLPEDFPKDVFVFEGKINTAIKSNDKNGYTISIESDKPIGEIKTAYEEKLKADGWKITGTMDFGTSVSVVAEKDNRNVSVMIGSDNEKSSIVLSVMDK